MVGIAVWVLWVLVLVAAGAVCECFLVIAMLLGMELNSFLYVRKLMVRTDVSVVVQILFFNFLCVPMQSTTQFYRRNAFGLVFRTTNSAEYIKGAFAEYILRSSGRVRGLEQRLNASWCVDFVREFARKVYANCVKTSRRFVYILFIFYSSKLVLTHTAAYHCN